MLCKFPCKSVHELPVVPKQRAAQLPVDMGTNWKRISGSPTTWLLSYSEKPVVDQSLQHFNSKLKKKEQDLVFNLSLGEVWALAHLISLEGFPTANQTAAVKKSMHWDSCNQETGPRILYIMPTNTLQKFCVSLLVGRLSLK